MIIIWCVLFKINNKKKSNDDNILANKKNIDHYYLTEME